MEGKMQTQIVTVSPESAGRRLDAFLADYFKGEHIGLSRTALQILIKNGGVKTGSEILKKSNYKIKEGDVITILFEEHKDSLIVAEDIPLDVVYEDDDIAVINKPPGLVVHPAPGNYEHTLVNALLNRFGQLSDINPLRPGIVHRLDKETSGVLVVARNNHAHLGLAEQFSDHSIKRTYWALVRGSMEFDEQIIEASIGRHPVRRKEMAVSFNENAKYARTYYKTLKRSKDFSLLELHPFTGRTHQLRVHLAFVGHPILGDEKYGRKNEFGRLALHAKTLGFIHPRTHKFIEFSSPLPKEFDDFLGRHNAPWYK